MEYEKVYSDFMARYKLGQVSGEEVGETIAILAHWFSKANLDMVAKDRALSIVALAQEGKTDDSGKAISSTKAKVFVDATPEANSYREARAHMENIQNYINSLKSLQKGILNEYAG